MSNLFNSYIEARIFFQGKVKQLKVSDLEEMKTFLIQLKDKVDYLHEKIEIIDLVIDIESRIDLLQDTELLLEIRRRDYKKSMANIPGEYNDLFNLELKEIEKETNLAVKIDKTLIHKVLIASNWNRARAARILGISHKGIRNKIERYQLK